MDPARPPERNAAFAAAVVSMPQATLTLDAPNQLLEAVAQAAGANVRAVWTLTTAHLKRPHGSSA